MLHTTSRRDRTLTDTCDPPFHPGYGVDPPALAGRDDLVDAALDAVRAGPRGPGFIQAFVGDRGVGKTALLNEIERRVRAELHWPVVTHQVVPGEPLLPVLARRLADAASSGWQRAGRFVRELDKALEVSADLLVVRATARVANGPSQRMPTTLAFEGVLRKIGEFASRRKSGVLVSIDEAHVLARADLAVLAASLQLAVKRSGLPIAVVFAGLPTFRRAGQGVGTFLERMPIRDVAYLSAESTRYALVKPAADRGVSFGEDALELLVAESGGYPYLVQLLGYQTWRAAKGASRIGLEHARTGAAAAMAEMEALFQARWDGLSDLERDYLYAVARHGNGPVEVGEVQAALGRTSKQLAPIRARLITEHHLLVPVRYGEVRMALGRFGSWVAARPEPSRARRRPPRNSRSVPT